MNELISPNLNKRDFQFRWVDWFAIFTRNEPDGFLIGTNCEGLESFANIFSELTEDFCYNGYDIYFDASDPKTPAVLEPESYPLAFVKHAPEESDTYKSSTPFIKTFLKPNFFYILANGEGFKLLSKLLIELTTSTINTIELDTNKYLQPGSVKLILKRIKGKQYETE